MKYSIILPVRNGGEYVKQCVASILNQSLENFNLHILDNSSTDGTSEWLKSIHDNRIILLPSVTSLSIEQNWSRIKDIPKNEFITLIGHDDLLDANYLQTMDDLIGKYPDATLYQTHFKYINAKGELIRHSKPMDEIQNAHEFVAFFLSNTIDIMGSGFMMRAADYDKIEGIPDRYPNLLFADFELFIKLTLMGFKVTSEKECFSFRLHQSATTTSPDVRFHNAYKIFIDFLVDLKEKDAKMKDSIERYSLNFIKFYCKGLAHRLLRTSKEKRQGETVSNFLAKSKEYADRLVPGNIFNPEEELSVKLAKRIDGNGVFRKAFLIFKKLRPRPVYD